MNYYSFHIGDYAVHTRHLSLLEDLAYRRCLDLYYTRESALPADPTQVARLIGMREHVLEVEAVLREFFAAEEHGDWIHMRCEAEIAKANEAAERARKNGRSGGRPPTKPKENLVGFEQDPRPNPDESKSKAPNTQYPIPNTKEKEKKTARGSRLPADWSCPDIWIAWARQERPDLDPHKVSAKFADHWHSKPGSAGCKLDWFATWRNWVREERGSGKAVGVQPLQSRQAALEARNREVANRFLEKIQNESKPD